MCISKQEKTYKVSMCTLVQFSDQTRGDGEIKEGKLCIQWKSKKKKIQSIWKIDSHFTFGVYYQHTDLTLHSETTHLAVSQWTHQLNFWVNSTCCESVNSTFVSQLSTCWVSLNQIPYIRYSDNSTTTDTFSLYRTGFYFVLQYIFSTKYMVQV